MSRINRLTGAKRRPAKPWIIWATLHGIRRSLGPEADRMGLVDAYVEVRLRNER